MTLSPLQHVTRCREDSGSTLQHYANKKRTDGLFNDVVVVAEGESIPANRLVLACFSKFFESVFLTPMKEQYENKVEIRQFNGNIVASVIDYMYNGNIFIDDGNVVDLVAVADFLQMEDVKQFGFEFLESNLTIENCLEILELSKLYHNQSLTTTIHKLISENFNEITQRDAFKTISKETLTYLITKLDFSQLQQSTLYNFILSWTQHNENRRSDFTALFLQLNLQKLSLQFLEEVVGSEPLVLASVECMKAVMASVFAKLRVDDSKGCKILCANGSDRKSVFEVYNSDGSFRIYPSLPNKPNRHCLLKLDDFVYSIGGNSDGRKTSEVYRMNLTESKLQWKKIKQMLQARDRFGAAVFNGKVIVNGGIPGNKTTELYDAAVNKWKTIASTNSCRYAGKLVAAKRALFAIGGFDGTSLSSVETLDDLQGQWREIKSMNFPRYDFAAVACKGFVYGIGGISVTKVEKSVEKYDPGNNKWTNVRSMKVERHDHAACVLRDKIYVIGGKNAGNVTIKIIECYDPELDQWTSVGETTEDCVYHAVTAL